MEQNDRLWWARDSPGSDVMDAKQLAEALQISKAAPYSEERRQAASEWTRKNGIAAL